MPSIEALAMAGADCNKCEIHLEDVEKRHTIYKTRPQYLLADEGMGSWQSGKKKKKGGGLIRKLGLGRHGKEVSNKEEVMDMAMQEGNSDQYRKGL
ncbi:hypothetical protein QQ045_027175 [Rhodiola kirilowii]